MICRDNDCNSLTTLPLFLGFFFRWLSLLCSITFVLSWFDDILRLLPHSCLSVLWINGLTLFEESPTRQAFLEAALKSGNLIKHIWPGRFCSSCWEKANIEWVFYNVRVLDQVIKVKLRTDVWNLQVPAQVQSAKKNSQNNSFIEGTQTQLTSLAYGPCKVQQASRNETSTNTLIKIWPVYFRLFDLRALHDTALQVNLKILHKDSVKPRHLA